MTPPFGKSFTFAFHDKDWLDKLLGGALCMILCGFIVGVPWALAYLREVFLRTQTGRDPILPDWKEMAGQWRTGLKMAAVVGLYSLPALFLLIFLIIIPLLTAHGHDTAALGSLPVHVKAFQAPALARLASKALIPVLLITVFLLPAALMHTAASGTPYAALEFKKIACFSIKRFPEYGNCFLMSFLAFSISLSGVIVFLVGFFFSFFWACLVTANVFGDFHRSLLLTSSEQSLPSDPPSEK